jgi:hypothetical protein
VGVHIGVSFDAVDFADGFVDAFDAALAAQVNIGEFHRGIGVSRKSNGESNGEGGNNRFHKRWNLEGWIPPKVDSVNKERDRGEFANKFRFLEASLLTSLVPEEPPTNSPAF